MDNKFGCLQKDLKPIGLDNTSANKHVPEIKRQNHVIKECARAIKCTLPFKKIPTIMIIEIISFVVTWLNVFPPKLGISKHLSPRAILVGTQLNYDKHCRIPFRAYAQRHEEKSPTNTLKDR
eukprot:9629561-Ditylum_brightwellii.AAC.1